MKTISTIASQKTQHGFSRLDLLVTMLVIAALAALKFSSLAGSRQPAQSVVCQNNLRQLGQALLMYSAENDLYFPERRAPDSWAERLRPYYKDLLVLQCPIDGGLGQTYGNGLPGDMAPRSYTFNGWDDYYFDLLQTLDWASVVMYARSNSMPEASIPLPNATILFSEKHINSMHFFMDILPSVGNDLSEVDQLHHFHTVQNNQSGGSNYSFADGSVKYLRYGEALVPENLWAVTEIWRQVPLTLP